MTKNSPTKIITAFANRISVSLLLLFLVLFLAACTSTQKAPSDRIETANGGLISQPYKGSGTIFSESQEKLELGERSSPVTQLEIIINNGEYDRALLFISSIDQKQLTLNEQARLSLAKATIYSAKNQNSESIAALNDIQLNLLSRQQTSRYYWIKARAMYFIGDFQQTLEALAQRQAFLPPEEQTGNQAMMERIIANLSPEQLIYIKQQSINPDLQYWFSKNPQIQAGNGLSMQPIDLIDNNLITRRPASNLPSIWSQQSPKQIAVLLPFNSKFSQAAEQFKQGFMAAHSQNATPYRPQIRFYDVGAGDIGRKISLANREGADFIVGPLGNQPAQTALTENSRTPIMALGSTVQDSENYSFSLNPEAEIHAITQHAKLQGLNSALVFAPNSERGNRLASAFSQFWQRLGGRAEIHRYNSDEFDHSATIKAAMGIYASEYRHSKLENIIGAKTKFTATRKANIDMIFLAGNFTDARNLKPQMNYYDGHQVPTYALSSVNSANARPGEKGDLDGLIIPEMPVLVQTEEGSGRLFALGYDAYQLTPIKEQLRADQTIGYAGKTGILTIDQLGNTYRHPTWAKFSSGKLSQIP